MLCLCFEHGKHAYLVSAGSIGYMTSTGGQQAANRIQPHSVLLGDHNWDAKAPRRHGWHIPEHTHVNVDTSMRYISFALYSNVAMVEDGMKRSPLTRLGCQPSLSGIFRMHLFSSKTPNHYLYLVLSVCCVLSPSCILYRVHYL